MSVTSTYTARRFRQDAAQRGTTKDGARDSEPVSEYDGRGPPAGRLPLRRRGGSARCRGRRQQAGGASAWWRRPARPLRQRARADAADGVRNETSTPNSDVHACDAWLPPLPAVVCCLSEPFTVGFFFVFCRRFFAGGTAGTISSATSTRRSSGAPVSQRPPPQSARI